MKGAKLFTKIDIRLGYYQIIIKEEDIFKITFRMRYRYYEFLVIPFDLINSLVMFICLMNIIFRECLDEFIMVFINDI